MTRFTAPRLENLEAEQALLGAILVNNEAYRRVAEFLRPEHFGEPVHQRIFAAIRTLIERAQIANPVTLKNLFDQDSVLTEIGGAQYLARLAASVVTIINAAEYGHQIYDLHLRRQLIIIGEDIVNDAYAFDLEREAPAQIETAEKKLFDLATLGEYESGFQPFNHALKTAIDAAEAAFQKSGRTIGVATGFADLDKNLGGLHPSDLIVLAGRPSMGKTALATNIAFNGARAYRAGKAADGRTIAEDGAVVGFFSLEMSAEQLATRVLSEQSGVSSDRIRRGEVSGADFDKFVRASLDLAEIPLYIDDTPALSITGLRTRARRLQRTHGLGLIVIDYLQLLRGSGDGPGTREPGTGGVGNHTRAQGARQGIECAGTGIVAVVAPGRSARGQAADAVRSTRIGFDRTGFRRGDFHLSRGILFEPQSADAAPRRSKRQIQRAL